MNRQPSRPGRFVGLSPSVAITACPELPGQERREWLKTINELARGRDFPAPATFDPRTPAHLIENPVCAALLAASQWPTSSPVVEAWLGEPVEITTAATAPFERYPGSNLLVIADEQTGYALLLASLLKHP